MVLQSLRVTSSTNTDDLRDAGLEQVLEELVQSMIGVASVCLRVVNGALAYLKMTCTYTTTMGPRCDLCLIPRMTCMSFDA